jgi:hypothetical protein
MKPFLSGRGKAVPPWGGGGGTMGFGPSHPANDAAKRKTAESDAFVIDHDLREIETRKEAGPSASLSRGSIVELMKRPQ